MIVVIVVVAVVVAVAAAAVVRAVTLLIRMTGRVCDLVNCSSVSL